MGHVTNAVSNLKQKVEAWWYLRIEKKIPSDLLMLIYSLWVLSLKDVGLYDIFTFQ